MTARPHYWIVSVSRKALLGIWAAATSVARIWFHLPWFGPPTSLDYAHAWAMVTAATTLLRTPAAEKHVGPSADINNEGIPTHKTNAQATKCVQNGHTFKMRRRLGFWQSLAQKCEPFANLRQKFEPFPNSGYDLHNSANPLRIFTENSNPSEFLARPCPKVRTLCEPSPKVWTLLTFWLRPA